MKFLLSTGLKFGTLHAAEANIGLQQQYRSVAQLGSASGLGPEGRRFESYHSDHILKPRRLIPAGFFRLGTFKSVVGLNPITKTLF